jgi:hypothetical protein
MEKTPRTMVTLGCMTMAAGARQSDVAQWLNDDPTQSEQRKVVRGAERGRRKLLLLDEVT